MKFIRHFALCILLILIVCVSVDATSYIPDNQTFRPLYSHNLSGYISPDQPLIISTDIRDSSTGFFRIFAWGPDQNTSDIDLYTSYGTKVDLVTASFNSTTEFSPEVITVRNLSSEYMVADPGEYTSLLTTAQTSGIAKVNVHYIYRENIDMGLIEDKKYSIWEINIPPGLTRVLFICESAYGTDLDLFIQKGTNLPDSFSLFNYSSTSNCTDCWDIGVDNWVAEILPIDNPEPGEYLMVTYARSGEDFFMSYMMGIEPEENMVPFIRNEIKSIQDTSEIEKKYRSIPFTLQYSPESGEENVEFKGDLNKAFEKN